MLGEQRSLRDIRSARSFRRVLEGVCRRARRRELHGPRRIRAGLGRRHDSRVRGKVRIPRRTRRRRRRRRAYLTLKVEPHVADFDEGIVPRLPLSGHAEPNQPQQANPPAAGNRSNHLNPFTVGVELIFTHGPTPACLMNRKRASDKAHKDVKSATQRSAPAAVRTQRAGTKGPNQAIRPRYPAQRMQPCYCSPAIGIVRRGRVVVNWSLIGGELVGLGVIDAWLRIRRLVTWHFERTVDGEHVILGIDYNGRRV